MTVALDEGKLINRIDRTRRIGLLVADAVDSIEQGIDRAAEAIDDGRAARTLQALTRLSGSSRP